MAPVLVITLVILLLALVSALARRGGAQASPPLMDQASDGTPARQTQFGAIGDVAALDRLLAQSFEAPVVLFLHDPGCPISGGAYHHMMELGAEVALVDLRRAHDLSRAIEGRTGVRHESPQVLVLHQGRATWSASHGAISTAAVTRALQGV